MKNSYAGAYLAAEGAHPWFVARRELFASLLEGPRSQRILDIGCGSGAFLDHLRALGYTRLEGYEPSARLREAPGLREGVVIHGRIPEGTYDAVFLLDVLEHVEDDGGMLRTVRGRLVEGGRLYLSVPAFPFLWSRHDEANMHRRRYTRRGLRRLLDAEGFGVERLSGWNLTLLPAVAMARLLGMGGGSLGAGRLLPPLAGLATLVLRAESFLLLRTGLPAGLSLVAVARRPPAASTSCGRRP